MPINPFRGPSNYDIPQAPPPAGRYDPSVFANIASIGENIGQYRENQALAEIGKGAIGPDGKLDIDKWVASNVLAGRNPIAMLKLAEEMRHQRATEGTGKTMAEAAKIAAERKLWTFDPNDPAGPGWRAPPDSQNPMGIWKPVEQGPTILPRTPAPQSALPPAPGGPSLAGYDPNDPENARPYQLAGSMQPPPSQPPQNQPVAQVQAKPAAQPAAELPPDFEQRIAPLPEGKRNEIRGIATYQDDPYKIKFPSEQLQRNYFNQIRDLYPGWTPEGYRLREEERKKQEALAETGPKAEQTKLGQERATMESDAVKDAKAAVDLQPILDDITKSYEALVNFRRFGTGKAGSGVATGTGPYAASAPSRLVQNYLPGGATTEEQLRQAYDRSLSALKAHATKVMNQGQGAVSNYEREMFAKVFPELTSSNPTGELATLRQMQARGRQVIDVGRETGLGKAMPGYLGDRPGVERPPLGTDRYLIDAQTAKAYREAPEMTLNRAREFIQNGADPEIVKGILRKIDPSLVGKL